jgi:ankyrin repeat protein
MTRAGRSQQAALMELIQALTAGNIALASQLLSALPDLACATLEEGATRQNAKGYFFDEIGHHLYAGDTVLHVAAAAYRYETVRQLIAAGADVRARNRRGAEPLHYAVDGVPGSRRWSPEAQAATVIGLIEAGADPNAVDKSGVAPLHRAVRTRCAAAVRALLENGANVNRKNKNGSTPLQLANRNTGRGGTGAPEAKAEQEKIANLLRAHGASA